MKIRADSVFRNDSLFGKIPLWGRLKKEETGVDFLQFGGK